MLSACRFDCAVCLIVRVVCTRFNVVCEKCVPLCPVMSVAHDVSHVVLFACCLCVLSMSLYVWVFTCVCFGYSLSVCGFMCGT